MRVLAALVLLPTLACAQEEPATARPLLFSEPITAAELDGTDPDREAEIAVFCRGDEDSLEVAPAAAGLIMAIVGATVEFLGDELGKRLERQISRFQKSYSAAFWTPYYDNTTKPRFRCIHITRKSRSAPDQPGLDLLLGVLPWPDSNETAALAIFPLRLWLSEPGPVRRASDDQYALALEVTLRSVVDGKARKVFEERVLSTAFQLAPEAIAVQYFAIPTGTQTLFPAGIAFVPVIPPPKSNEISYFSFRISEQGNTPRFLRYVRDVYGNAQRDLEKLLIDLAEKQLEP